MKPGEIVVARLGKGASIVQYLEGTATQAIVALGRNRQARIPPDRILLATGLVPSGQEELDEFRRQSQDLSIDIDLSELWEVAGDNPAPISFDSLAELYWGSSPKPAQTAALALHLDQNSDHFSYGSDGYTTRSRASLTEIQARRRREAESAEAAASLMSHLSDGSLPEPLSSSQMAMLQHLRGYAVHGEDYARSEAARRLLETLAEGTRDLQRHCFELLVTAGVFDADEPLEMHHAGIRVDFTEDALAEAAAMDDPAGLPLSPRRRDLTDLPAFTIDYASTEDRDDALSLELQEPSPDTSSPGYRIGIHIADAGTLIPHGGAIDAEADHRMATLYLPERTIGMLPPDFSSRLGSLEPGETRLAVSLLVQTDPSGQVTGWEITPSTVRSRAALTYEDAELALKNADSPWHQTLARLSKAAEGWRRKREMDGAINLDQAEMAIEVKASGEVAVTVHRRSSPARQLVTELMILCNSMLAEFCRREGLAAVYRSQAPPDLAEVADDPRTDAEAAVRRYMITRRLSPVELSTVPAPHWGLGVPAYIQATSPLRRYPDLVMQRQIGQYLGVGKPLYSLDTVTSVFQRAEVQLRELARLEEARKRFWFLKYLQQSRLEGPGPAAHSAPFKAIVLANEPGRTATLELVEFPFRVRANLSGTCVPGDTVTLELQGVDLWRRVGYFVHTHDDH